MRPGAQKGVLGDVFGLRLAQPQTAQKAKQRALVQVHQLGKSPLLTPGQALQDGLNAQGKLQKRIVMVKEPLR
jgi:hypothetical protein